MTTRKRKKSIAPFVIIVLVIAALLVGTLVYMAYNSYIKQNYPIKFENYVEKYSAEFNVDKYLVYAVIKTESGFRQDAVSNVGARGLMQIMEDTFDWIKFKMDDDDAVYYDMYDPEKNIKYGCWLLGYLYDEFGNVEAVAAAYHAGRGNVNEWLADKRYSLDGEHLDKIPIKDTEYYVHKITKAMDMYLKLYNKK